ncbi:uncharacterized protein [Apostichopus japonicus]|uniref:uncharacterized protein isoform X2 n=1 Tax=Stichopus japonicus TaxID=307972 RepID=UPI003AB517C1
MEVGPIFFRTFGSLMLICWSLSCCPATSVPRHRCRGDGREHDGRCFWFMQTKASWADANVMCSRLFGDHVTLTTIKDAITNTFVRLGSDSTLWIGLHEAHGEGEWRWVDHSLASTGPHVYSNWEASAPTPDSTLKNCAAMYRGSDQWRDVGCKKKYRFVCSELPSAPVCPNGGTYFRDRCYWAAEPSLPFNAAEEYCWEHFGPDTHITTSKDAEVNLFLSRLVYPGIWLGLHDRHSEGVWEWIDSSPLEYTNWRVGEPNNVGEEDCAVLHYDDASWNDQPCGNSVIKNSNRFICSVPPCFQFETYEHSGLSFTDDDSLYEDIICLETECTRLCVDGGVCNGTNDECVCVKQFPHMVCDTADWRMNIEPNIINATVGGSFTVYCWLNLPAEHIALLEWSKVAGGEFDESRTNIYNVFYKGYSMLHVTEVEFSDAQEYACRVVAVINGLTVYLDSPVSTGVVTVSEATTQVPTTRVTTTESRPDDTTTMATTTPITTPTTTPTTTPITTPTKPTDSPGRNTPTSTDHGNQDKNKHVDNKVNPKAAKHFNENSYNRGRGATATIVILAMMVALLLVAVVGLMIKVKRLENESFGSSRLVEMHDRF